MLYKDFDKIVTNFGYELSKDSMVHNYFNWTEIRHWKFDYELYSAAELKSLFSKSPIPPNTLFYVRLCNPEPLREMRFSNLVELLEDLTIETAGMGWEAVSSDGQFIIEFTDDYMHEALTNFRITDKL